LQKKSQIYNQVNNSENTIFRPIHYLGSKLRILDFIEDTINRIDPNKGRVYDLFSGSVSVSFKLSRTRAVTSVDIQEYSRVISSALLDTTQITDSFIKEFYKRISLSIYQENLIWAIDPLIQYEIKCINKAIKGELEDLCSLLENGYIIGFEKTKEFNGDETLLKKIKESLKRIKAKSITNKQSIVIRYFGGVYFSYKQAAQIDAILEEIEMSPIEFRDKLLASLISTISECVNTVGKQFAQPLRPRKANGEIKHSLGKIVSEDRSKDIIDVFKKWLKKYNSISNSYDNQSLRMDYRDALDQISKDTTVVYADPPYTRDHYSRFYHVLETIALRDSPEISTMKLKGKTVLSRGLYRIDRHQSPFCIRSQAMEAFEAIFSKSSLVGAKLVLSYSPYDETKKSHPRVVTMTQLIELAEKYYSYVEIVSPGNFVHSKLNHAAKHLEASVLAEVLIVCSN